MFKIRVLNQNNTEEVLDMQKVIDEIEKVYQLKAQEKANLFPMIFHEFEPGVADMDIKSGCIEDSNIFGLKLVSWFGDNKEKSLPQLVGTVMVFDNRTGVPLGILSGEHITGMRTGAAGAIGAKLLARKDSENLLIVGTGHQSKYQIAATLIALKNIKNVRIYDPLNFDSAVSLTNSIKNTLKEEFLSKYQTESSLYETISKKFDVNLEAVSDLKEAVGVSDVIITITPSRKPMIMKEWVKTGTHFSCVGSDMSGKQEIDENIFKDAKVFADDINQSINVGETEIAVKKGIIDKESIVEIGKVIGKEHLGRTSTDDITIYDSTGIALQDLATAKLALQIAEEKEIGVLVDL